jgi:hypothetical protein
MTADRLDNPQVQLIPAITCNNVLSPTAHRIRLSTALISSSTPGTKIYFGCLEKTAHYSAVQDADWTRTGAIKPRSPSQSLNTSGTVRIGTLPFSDWHPGSKFPSFTHRAKATRRTRGQSVAFPQRDRLTASR